MQNKKSEKKTYICLNNIVIKKLYKIYHISIENK